MVSSRGPAARTAPDDLGRCAYVDKLGKRQRGPTALLTADSLKSPLERLARVLLGRETTPAAHVSSPGHRPESDTPKETSLQFHPSA